jgi:hypothetical protein
LPRSPSPLSISRPSAGTETDQSRKTGHLAPRRERVLLSAKAQMSRDANAQAGDLHARPRAHDGRVARLLETRLEGLAVLSERSACSPVRLERGVVALEAATRHAVALGLLSPSEAARIWAGAARRHPAVRWCRVSAP